MEPRPTPMSTAWLLVCTVTTGLHASGAWAKGVCPGAGVNSDTFDESLSIRRIPHTANLPLFLGRMEFVVQAKMSDDFFADHFDLMPKPIGKLLTGRPSLLAFEASLTQGRWKEDEWGPAWRDFKPPGATLIATVNASGARESEDTWSILTSAMSGSLCGSFEGMDTKRTQTSQGRPLNVRWAERETLLRSATLPYEPVCTENLTPWLKLLPCGHAAGLASLIAPLALAESPLKILSISALVDPSQSKVSFTAALDFVHPVADSHGLASWFGRRGNEKLIACAAAASSTVTVWSAETPDEGSIVSAGASVTPTAGGFSSKMPLTLFADMRDSKPLALSGNDLPKPWQIDGSLAAASGASRLAVMRDMLAVAGRSERRHGRYLLRVTNFGARQQVLFMDQLPFFLRPSWRSFQATFETASGVFHRLEGAQAMQRLGLRFVSSDGATTPTEISFSLDVEAGAVVNVHLDVLKEFLPVSRFSYACEKGFDVSSAMWLEREHGGADEDQNPQLGRDELVSSFWRGGPSVPSAWRLRYTEGLLVLVPMPDFSMPFNVIAITVTAVMFFWGSIFKLTAAGKLMHWSLKTDSPEERKRAKRAKIIRLMIVVGIGGMLYHIAQLEDADVSSLREAIPEPASDIVIGLVGTIRPHVAVWFKS